MEQSSSQVLHESRSTPTEAELIYIADRMHREELAARAASDQRAAEAHRAFAESYRKLLKAYDRRLKHDSASDRTGLSWM